MKGSIAIGILSMVVWAGAMPKRNAAKPIGEKDPPPNTTKAPLAPPPSSSPKALTSGVPNSSPTPKLPRMDETFIGSPEAVDVFNELVKALKQFREMFYSTLNIDFPALEGSRAMSNSKPAASVGATGTGQYSGASVIQSILSTFNFLNPGANSGSTGKQATPKGKAPTQTTFAKAAKTLFNGFSEEGLIGHTFSQFG